MFHLSVTFGISYDFFYFWPLSLVIFISNSLLEHYTVFTSHILIFLRFTVALQFIRKIVNATYLLLQIWNIRSLPPYITLWFEIVGLAFFLPTTFSKFSTKLQGLHSQLEGVRDKFWNWNLIMKLSKIAVFNSFEHKKIILWFSQVGAPLQNCSDFR